MVAVCEVSEERAKEYAEKNGCEAYTDMDAFLAHPGLDLGAAGQARVLAQYDAIADQVLGVGTSNDGSG